MSPAVIIIGLCCFIVVVTAVILYFTNALCGLGWGSWIGFSCPSTDSPAPGPSPGPSPDPCTGLTPTSLAKDVPVSCLQKIWTDKGCSVTGTAYPQTGSKGWWNSSPGGLGTTVLCDGGKVSGDAAGNCGAGNYGAIISDMNIYATSTTPARVTACRGPQS
jgi:hypothetical protein